MVDELLFKTDHGLIDQSLHARMGVETTNGDAFGLGWYGANGGPPGRYRSVTPAWSDANLRDLAAHVESPLFLAHIRGTTGTPVQQSNCHPFRQGQWLFVHNGVIAGFADMRRELLLAVEPSLFDDVVGSTDSEALFYLALTFGLEDDPLGALERAVGFVEATGREHGIEHPIQMTVWVSNGERLWAVRYSTEHESRTLFVSEHVDALRKLHPDNAPAAVHRRGSHRRLRAARRSPRSLAPDCGVDGADHPARRRRTTAIQPALAVRDRRITMSTCDVSHTDPRRLLDLERQPVRPLVRHRDSGAGLHSRAAVDPGLPLLVNTARSVTE